MWTMMMVMMRMRMARTALLAVAVSPPIVRFVGDGTACLGGLRGRRFCASSQSAHAPSAPVFKNDQRIRHEQGRGRCEGFPRGATTSMIAVVTVATAAIMSLSMTVTATAAFVFVDMALRFTFAQSSTFDCAAAAAVIEGAFLRNERISLMRKLIVTRMMLRRTMLLVEPIANEKCRWCEWWHSRRSRGLRPWTERAIVVFGHRTRANRGCARR